MRTGAAVQAQGSAAVQWLSQGSASAKSGSFRAQHRESTGWCRWWQWLRQLMATCGGGAGAVKNQGSTVARARQRGHSECWGGEEMK